MNGLVIEKLTGIEKLLAEIDKKIDNFLGFEELSDDGMKEIKKIREEIKRGKYVTLEKAFKKSG